MMFFDELLEKLAQVFGNVAEQVEELMKRLDSMFGDEAPMIWKPYRCRICGHAYMTSAEVRDCVTSHQRSSTKSSLYNARKPIYNSCLHIMPRSREARMRSTEYRRFKAENSRRRRG